MKKPNMLVLLALAFVLTIVPTLAFAGDGLNAPNGLYQDRFFYSPVHIQGMDLKGKLQLVRAQDQHATYYVLSRDGMKVVANLSTYVGLSSFIPLTLDYNPLNDSYIDISTGKSFKVVAEQSPPNLIAATVENGYNILNLIFDKPLTGALKAGNFSVTNDLGKEVAIVSVTNIGSPSEARMILDADSRNFPEKSGNLFVQYLPDSAFLATEIIINVKRPDSDNDNDHDKKYGQPKLLTASSTKILGVMDLVFYEAVKPSISGSDFMVLDSQGKRIKVLSAWISGMPNEVKITLDTDDPNFPKSNSNVLIMYRDSDTGYSTEVNALVKVPEMQKPEQVRIVGAKQSSVMGNLLEVEFDKPIEHLAPGSFNVLHNGKLMLIESAYLKNGDNTKCVIVLNKADGNYPTKETTLLMIYKNSDGAASEFVFTFDPGAGAGIDEPVEDVRPASIKSAKQSAIMRNLLEVEFDKPVEVLDASNFTVMCNGKTLGVDSAYVKNGDSFKGMVVLDVANNNYPDGEVVLLVIYKNNIGTVSEVYMKFNGDSTIPTLDPDDILAPVKIVLDKQLPSEINCFETVDFKILTLDVNGNEIDYDSPLYSNYYVRVMRSGIESIEALRLPVSMQEYTLSELSSGAYITAGLIAGKGEISYELMRRGQISPTGDEKISDLKIAFEVKENTDTNMLDILPPTTLKITEIPTEMSVNTSTRFIVDVLDKHNNRVKAPKGYFDDYIVYLEKLSGTDNVIMQPSIKESYELEDLGCYDNYITTHSLIASSKDGKETIKLTLVKKLSSEIIDTKVIDIEVDSKIPVPTKLEIDRELPAQISTNKRIYFRLKVLDQFGKEIDYAKFLQDEVNSHVSHRVGSDKTNYDNDIIKVPLRTETRADWYKLEDLGEEIYIWAGPSAGKVTIIYKLIDNYSQHTVDSVEIDIEVVD